MSTVLVTGANRGIGLEYCRQLQQRGDQVIAVCRQSSPELDAIDVEIESGVDLTNEANRELQRESLSRLGLICNFHLF